MTRNLIFALTILCSASVFAQQSPQFSQFMQTGNVNNPALTGVNKYTDFKIGYRKQWAGIPNSPTTFFASVGGQFGTVEPSISLPVRGRLANQFVTEKPPVKSGIKHALGGFILADQTGPTAMNIGNISYAMHIELTKKLHLSAGLGLSVSQTSLNRDKLNVDVKVDPGIGSGISSKLNPDLNGGVFLYSDRYFVGYSANHLFRNKIYSLSDNNTSVGKQKVHHYGLAGTKFDLNDNWHLVPSVMVKYVNGVPPSFDANLRVGFKEVIWFGPAFRNQDSFSAIFGAHLSNFVSLSYSYDYTYSKLNTASNGSHELILGLRLVRSGATTARPTMW
jgi:type IX secretion system PorP/SprF family membrane protein